MVSAFLFSGLLINCEMELLATGLPSSVAPVIENLQLEIAHGCKSKQAFLNILSVLICIIFMVYCSYVNVSDYVLSNC